MSARHVLSRSLLAGVLLLTLPLLPRASAAQPFGWLLPQGGEVWTAGTTHSVEWTGGNAGWLVNVSIISLVPFQVADVVAVNTANDGYASWTIPANLAPGAYQLYVEEVSQSTYTYSPTFTVQAPPDCGPECTLISASMPVFEPPAGACGQTAADAEAAADAYVRSRLVCQVGYILDVGSIVVDVTVLPVGVCLSGYSGAVVAEASAVACCCPLPLPAIESTWGHLKSLHR